MRSGDAIQQDRQRSRPASRTDRIVDVGRREPSTPSAPRCLRPAATPCPYASAFTADQHAHRPAGPLPHEREVVRDRIEVDLGPQRAGVRVATGVLDRSDTFTAPRTEPASSSRQFAAASGSSAGRSVSS